MGVLTASIVGVYAALVWLATSDVGVYRGAHLPPTGVTLFLMLDGGGFPWIAIGGVVHAMLFVLAGAHVLRRAPGNQAEAAALVRPAWVGLLSLAGLSTLPWIMGAGADGLRYQGLWLVMVYGGFGFATITILLLWLLRLSERASSKGSSVRTELLLVQFAAHVATLVLLFPTLGETP
jgi:hypothetical protein